MDVSCITSDHDPNSFNVEGQEMTYYQTGEGELLVFLPPPLCDKRIYCHLQESLSEKYRIVGLDLPAEKKVDTVITTLQKAIRKGTTQPFHLVASSATGWIAQFLAQQFPNQILSLILINSFYDNSKYDSKYKLALKSSKFVPGFKFRKEVISGSSRLVRSPSDRKILKTYFKQRVKIMGKSGIRKQLYWFVENKSPPQKLLIPVLAVFSQNDPFITPTDKKSLLQIHENVTSVSINSSSHFLFLSHPDKVEDHIRKFLSSLE